MLGECTALMMNTFCAQICLTHSANHSLAPATSPPIVGKLFQSANLCHAAARDLHQKHAAKVDSSAEVPPSLRRRGLWHVARDLPNLREHVLVLTTLPVRLVDWRYDNLWNPF